MPPGGLCNLRGEKPVEAAHLGSAHAEGFAPTSQVLGRETDTRPSLD